MAVSVHPKVQTINQEDSEQEEAINSLLRLYEMQGDWAALVMTLQEQQPLCESVEAKKKNLYRLAEINLNQLSQIDEALYTWQSILELDPLDAVALDSLKHHYREETRWSDLVALLEDEREHREDDPQKQLQIDVKLARLYRAELNNPIRAIEICAAVLEESEALSQGGERRNPAEESAAVQLLEEFLTEGESLEESGNALASYYEKGSDHQELARVLSELIKSAPDDFQRVELLQRRGPGR